jgi:hypothetical protein
MTHPCSTIAPFKQSISVHPLVKTITRSLLPFAAVVAVVAVLTQWYPNDHIVFDNPDEEFVLPVIPITLDEDSDAVHTPENGYVCGDPTCYCAQTTEEEEDEEEDEDDA